MRMRGRGGFFEGVKKRREVRKRGGVGKNGEGCVKWSVCRVWSRGRGCVKEVGNGIL